VTVAALVAGIVVAFSLGWLYIQRSKMRERERVKKIYAKKEE